MSTKKFDGVSINAKALESMKNMTCCQSWNVSLLQLEPIADAVSVSVKMGIALPAWRGARDGESSAIILFAAHDNQFNVIAVSAR